MDAVGALGDGGSTHIRVLDVPLPAGLVRQLSDVVFRERRGQRGCRRRYRADGEAVGRSTRSLDLLPLHLPQCRGLGGLRDMQSTKVLVIQTLRRVLTRRVSSACVHMREQKSIHIIKSKSEKKGKKEEKGGALSLKITTLPPQDLTRTVFSLGT